MSCDALLRSSASLQKPLWRCGDAGKGLEALSAVKWRAIEIAFLLMQHEPRTSSVEHRFRHEFLAFLPHLDVRFFEAVSGPLDLRVRTLQTAVQEHSLDTSQDKGHQHAARYTR